MLNLRPNIFRRKFLKTLDDPPKTVLGGARTAGPWRVTPEKGRGEPLSSSESGECRLRRTAENDGGSAERSDRGHFSFEPSRGYEP